MRISGAGITAFDMFVLEDYTTKTSYGFRYQQVSDGSYRYADQGSDVDTRSASITIKGKIEDIEKFLEEAQSNRVAGNAGNILKLSDINDSEKIFGEDVNYLAIGIAVTILSLSEIKQVSFNVFTLDIELRLLPGASFVGTPGFPVLNRILSGYTSDNKWSIVKQDSYDGSYTYIEKSNDVGYFTCQAIITKPEMIGILRHIAVNRGDKIYLDMTEMGIPYPFGKPYGAWNRMVTMLEFEDLGLYGLDNYMVGFKFTTQ